MAAGLLARATLLVLLFSASVLASSGSLSVDVAVIGGGPAGYTLAALLASQHGVTSAHVLVRWSMQHGYVPLPKSVRAERVAENIHVLHFELSADDMAKLDALDERLFTEWAEWGELDPTELP